MSIQWVLDFLNSVDLRLYGGARAVLVRDRLGDQGDAREWLHEHGFNGSVEGLLGEIEALRALRDAVRAGLTNMQPLRITWTAQVEISGGEHPQIRPVSESLNAWAEAHLLEAFFSPFVSRLRVCAADDCLRAFYDRSKNGRAKWCSTTSCGNRMKTRAYRERRRSQANAAPSVAAPRRVAQRTSRFRREGDYWTIGPPRKTFRLKDSKGLQYLARLLAEPDREFHALDLAGSGRAATVPPVEVPMLDPEASRRYRKRVRELQEAIAEAEAWNEEARAAIARDELSAVAEELARSTGLHGRPRTFASESERARISVTRVIKAALSRIGEESPELKHHFASTVRTGIYCSYNPDPRLPIRWEL